MTDNQMETKLFWLSTDSGVTDASNNYSGALTRFILRPTGRLVWNVYRVFAVIEDADTDYNLFGNLAALTNGVELHRERLIGSTYEQIEQLLAGETIKKTEDWQRIGANVVPLNDSAAATRSTMVTVFDAKAGGHNGRPIILNARFTDLLAWHLNDDLSGLDGLRFGAEIVQHYGS